METVSSPSLLCPLCLRFAVVLLQIVFVVECFWVADASNHEFELQRQNPDGKSEYIVSHSCIHDQIIEQRRLPGRKVYSVTPQVYDHSGVSEPLHRRGRALLGLSETKVEENNVKQPLRIFLNYDAVGHSSDRDCQKVGDIVKLGEPSSASHSERIPRNPLADPTIYGDCWYNCTFHDIAGEDKRHRLRKVGRW